MGTVIPRGGGTKLDRTYPEGLRPGFDFTKRYLLRLAVVLVGFRITTRLLLDLGVVPLAVD